MTQKRKELLIFVFVGLLVLTLVAYFHFSHQAKKSKPSASKPYGKVIHGTTPSATSPIKADAVKPGPGRYYHHDGTDVLLPNPNISPGLARPDATVDEVCHTNTAEFRHTTAAMKAQVYEAYDTAPHEGYCADTYRFTKSGREVKEACEVDHIISLELGGADDVRNLFPQPFNPPNSVGAHAKDKVENWLHRQVCNGTMSLEQAQQAIVTDWYQIYLDNHLDD